jgi:hypothetical protein
MYLEIHLDVLMSFMYLEMHLDVLMSFIHRDWNALMLACSRISGPVFEVWKFVKPACLFLCFFSLAVS